MAEKSKKILIFTTAFRPMTGGSEIAVEEICKRLEDISFDIITPRYKKSFIKKECTSNICVHRVGMGSKLDKFLFPVTGFLKSLILAKKNDYDAIHAYQASYGAGAAVIFKLFKPNKKFILTLQEGKDLEKQNFFIKLLRKLIIKKANTLTAISEYLKNYIQKINPTAKITLIPNGIDYEKFISAKPQQREELGIDKTAKVIITISRLVPKNGLVSLIKSIEIAKSVISDIKLIIIGSGPLETGLKNLTAELNLSGDILFLGEKKYSEIPHFLKTADLFIRPSHSEGLGNAFIEAMAAGIPIIGTPVGGIPDFLKDGETGLFCEVGNPKDLAEKIIHLLNNQELREKLIKNGLEMARAKYNWNNIAKKFREIYSKTNN